MQKIGRYIIILSSEWGESEQNGLKKSKSAVNLSPEKKGRCENMLTGEFKHTLDAKGRVFVPAKFRADLGEHVVVARTFGKFLVMYSEEEWVNFMEKLDALAETEDIGDMKRYIMKNAMPTDVDAQGRINISNEQRAFAGLDKDVSFIGMRKYVEIWSSDTADEDTTSYDIEKFKEQSKEIHLGLC